MPITGPASYVPTTDEFIAHWTHANADSAPKVVVVAPARREDPAIPLATLVALRAQLITERTAVVTGLNKQHVAREKGQMQKRLLLERYDQFAGLLRAFFSQTPYLSSLPVKPSETELPARFLDTMEAILSLWVQIEDDAPPLGVELPLVLKDDFDITGMQDGIALLRALLLDLAQKEQATSLARSRRNQVQDKIYPILRDYRLAVPAILGKNSPHTETLPRLSPLPGKTPTGVNASGTFITPQNEARIVHTLSPDTDISHYELRQCPPPDYVGDDETIIATHPAGAPPEFLTQAGLVIPGDRSLFKVVTINEDGREKASNVVDITWPAA
ncbi:MAG: hypothetical protein V4726_18460 [Verrucomicrobiota bacterium]